MRKACFAIIGIVGLVSACGSPDTLHDFRLKRGAGPDAFSVTTQRPLEAPSDFSNLPAPGGTNRADVNPSQDLNAALGARGSSSAIPASDGALLAHTARFGREADIRATLDAADAQFRKRRARVPGLIGGNGYFAAYRFMSLDARAELERFRAAGVKTPTAPPQ